MMCQQKLKHSAINHVISSDPSLWFTISLTEINQTFSSGIRFPFKWVSELTSTYHVVLYMMNVLVFNKQHTKQLATSRKAQYVSFPLVINKVHYFCFYRLNMLLFILGSIKTFFGHALAISNADGPESSGCGCNYLLLSSKIMSFLAHLEANCILPFVLWPPRSRFSKGWVIFKIFKSLWYIKIEKNKFII